MSALRIVLLAIFAVGLSSAQYASCPTAPGVGDLFGMVNCTAAKVCQTNLCVCMGTTMDATTLKCGVATTKPSCAVAAGCIHTFGRCLVHIAALNQTQVGDCFNYMLHLRMSLMAAAAGEVWNATAAGAACRSFACHAMNGTTATNCSATAPGNLPPYDAICPPPFNSTWTIPLDGNFTKILANATALADMKDCLGKDLSHILRLPVWIKSITGTATGVVVEFYIPVAAGSPLFSARKAELKLTNFMCFTAAKFAALGGTGTLNTGTVGTPTTAPPATVPTTTSGTTTPGQTTATPTTTAAPTSGAALSWSMVQVALAVLAVLVIA